MKRTTRITTICASLALLLGLDAWTPAAAHAACLSNRRYDSTGTLMGQATTIPIWINNGPLRGIQNTGLDVVTATEAINSALAKLNEASVGLPRLQLMGYVVNNTLASRPAGITIDGEFTDCSDPGMDDGTIIGLFRSLGSPDNDDVLITMGRPACHPNGSTWSTDLTGDLDFEATVLHELGHALGLWHTTETPSTSPACPAVNFPENLAGMTRGTMDPSALSGIAGRYLWRDDIEGLRRKYNTPNFCLNNPDCGGGAIECNDDFECSFIPSGCFSDSQCTVVDPALRCVDNECAVPGSHVRVHRPYFNEAQSITAWGPRVRFPDLEQVACYQTPSMSATPIDATASPAGAGLGTDHQLVTMVDESGYVMIYPATGGGFCEKGEYRVWPYGEGRRVYQRPVAAVGEDHGMVAWIGNETFDSLSVYVYFRPLEFTGACEFQWNDGGPRAVRIGSTKESIGLAYNASTDEFVLTHVGTDGRLRVRRISHDGVPALEARLSTFKVVEAGSPRCHKGSCVVPARTMDHCPAWISFNLANPGLGAGLTSDCARASAGYRDSVPDRSSTTRGFTTHKRRSGLNAAAIGTQELRVQQLDGLVFGATVAHPFLPPAPAPDWAGDLGTQTLGAVDLIRLFHLAPDDPLVEQAPTVCIGANCPVDCGGIPDEPDEFAECDLEGILDGQGAGCPCAETEPSEWPDESAIPDGPDVDNKYCLDDAPYETHPLVCAKAPNGYHDMCLRCNVDTMEGCECDYDDECIQFGEDLTCFGSLEAGWNGDSGKCWKDPPPSHICAENCSTLGRVCFYGDWFDLTNPIDPAQCVNPICGPECEDDGLVCDPNTSQCVVECVDDQDCYDLHYPFWYACDAGTCESAG